MKSLASWMSLLFIVLVVILDAVRLKKEQPAIYRTRMNAAPGIWGLLTALFSVIALPIYLVSRNQYFADYRSLPPEEQPSRGINSFLKTCLAAKIILTWSLFVEIASLVIMLLTRYAGISGDLLPPKLDIQMLSTVLFLCVFFILARHAAKEYPSLGFKAIFDLRFDKTNKMKSLALPLLAGFLMALVFFCLIKLRKVSPPTPLGTALAESASWVKLCFLAFATLLAPLFEELIYRGLFFRVLLKNKGKVLAILGPSLCFWALHADRAGDNLALGALLLFSCCMTWMRFWTRSTLTPVLMHYTYNISLAAMAVLFLLITNISLLRVQYLDFYPKERREPILLEALEKNPKLPGPYNDLAWFYATENRDLDKALSLVEKALEIEPESPDIWDTKATVLSKLGRANEAMALEKVLVDRYPNVPFFKQQLETFRQKKSAALPQKPLEKPAKP
ncbi:MAG TPA: CPBP family glutamic-type intramembrane protease [Candidatus Omnitrophota bacterium]|nr:CPBP family glutamic-type intramembrane protease [Candidatus Omnitrophota bacterium]HPS36987.1 CPBP family glutamic-type intramembrane protease [Candidatus Omnitrophota bacterium]